MKFTSYILSLIILLMVAIPCNDAIYTNNDDTNITQLEQSVSDHSHDLQDDCSPVCGCICCGTLITLTNTHTFKNSEETLYFSNHFRYSFLYSYKFAKGIWHPPLLS